MFTNVMWATDGSAHADRALGYATRVALRDGATLHAVHVVEKFATGRVAGQNAHLDEQAIDAKIQREVADPIALELLKGEYQTGDSILVDARPDGGLVFDSAATADFKTSVTSTGRSTRSPRASCTARRALSSTSGRRRTSTSSHPRASTSVGCSHRASRSRWTRSSRAQRGS